MASQHHGAAGRSSARRTAVAAIGSALFFLAAPGVVAGLGPWLVTGYRSSDPFAALQVVGGGMILAGVVALLDSFARFVVEGTGTPAPGAPTERLVVGGLYRYVRNPMYLAVAMIIIGQALLFGQLSLLAYASAFFLLVAAFVRFYEEPLLESAYGAEYRAYKRAVRAWWPRLHPWEPGSASAAQ